MAPLFRALVNRNDVVADIGANIGMTALLFSSLARKTYALEPSPSTYRILSENLIHNGIANVEALNLGLGQKEEFLTITFAQNNRACGYVSDKICPETGHVAEEIRLDTLYQFFAGKEPTPTFLKIDVEGFEEKVVRGGAFLKPLGRATSTLTKACKTRPIVKPAGALIALGDLRQIMIGETVQILVSVANQSQEAWHGHGDHPVLLSYHWNNYDGSNQV